MLRGFAKLAVAVTIAGPSFSRVFDDGQIARWSKGGGLGYLMKGAWAEGEAAETGVSVSEAAVRQNVLPPRDGLTQQDAVYFARIELLTAALKAPVLQAAAQSVTQAQIDEYVAQHPRFQPEERAVQLVRLRDRATAERALTALERGLSFTATTKRYARGRGGLLVLSRGEPNRTKLVRAIFGTPARRYARYGIYVFRVKEIRPREPLPLDQQKAQAWERLAGQAQVNATREYEAAIAAKWRPRTTCAATVTAKEFCSNSPTG